MFYYQYDALLKDRNRQEMVGFVFKSPTYFSGTDIQQCHQFLREYLRTVIKHDSVMSDKLTYLSEHQAAGISKNRGFAIESIPCVMMEEMA
jgi:hypothetical protein